MSFASPLSVQSARDTVLAALSQDFASRAERHDADGSFPFENIEQLRQAGLLALLIPPEEGGSGGGLLDALVAVREVSKGDSATGLALTLQYLIHAQVLRSPQWPASLRAKIFHSSVKDGALANTLRVEPELGTPVRGGLPATIARRVPGGWSISGRKIYSTSSPGLTWFGVWARSDDEIPLVGTWIVPKGTPGLRIEETWNHLGLRASGSHDVVFEDVFVPEDHAADIRRVEDWGSPDPVTAAWVTILFTAVYDGVARAARDWLVKFLRERRPTNLGHSLAELPRLQEALGEIEALLNTNNLLLESIAQAVDRGEAKSPTESALVKYTVSENAIAAVSKAVEVSGNPGLNRHNSLQRHLRDVLCARVHSPQKDTILIGAGRAALGAL